MQRQELYDQRHGGSSLQGEKRYEKVNDGSIRNSVARHVGHSSVLEVGLDRKMTKGRNRKRRRGSGGERVAGRIVKSGGTQGSGSRQKSEKGSNSRKSLVEINVLVNNSLLDSVPHIRNEPYRQHSMNGFEILQIGSVNVNSLVSKVLYINHFITRFRMSIVAVCES